MAAYYGMITEIDDGIGSIIQKLKEKGLYDNTIIVFTSDHGEYLEISPHDFEMQSPL